MPITTEPGCRGREHARDKSKEPVSLWWALKCRIMSGVPGHVVRRNLLTVLSALCVCVCVGGGLVVWLSECLTVCLRACESMNDRERQTDRQRHRELFK